MNRRHFFGSLLAAIGAPVVVKALPPPLVATPTVVGWRLQAAAFKITEEALEDNLYAEIGRRYTQALSVQINKNVALGKIQFWKNDPLSRTWSVPVQITDRLHKPPLSGQLVV